MIYFYLLANAFIYIGLGIWCTFSPQKTAKGIAISPEGQQGLAEYIAVYGGLQVALGLFFLWTAFSPERHYTGILFATIVYSCLVFFRSFSIFSHGSNLDTGWYFYGFEGVMFLAALILLRVIA